MLDVFNGSGQAQSIPFLGNIVVSAKIERDGLSMDFVGWAYTLEGFFGALERAGFMIQAVREPRMDESAVRKYPSEERWQRIPNFLMWRALKP